MRKPGSKQQEVAVPTMAARDEASEPLELMSTPWLEDARLLDYRDPTERPKLAVTLLLLAGILAAGIFFKSGTLLRDLGLLWLSMTVTAYLAATRYTLRGAEVTSTQFPEVYEIVQELSRRFQAPPTRVFVIREARYQAYALGVRAPYVIVLPHLVVDALNIEELAFVLGQQFGHIRFGHTRIAVLLGGDASSLPSLLSWIAPIRDAFFAAYRRAQITSADRAGLLACHSLSEAFRTQIKLDVGPNQVRHVRWDDLVQQAARVRRERSFLQILLVHLPSSTPSLIQRLSALLKWAKLQQLDAAQGKQER